MYKKQDIIDIIWQYSRTYGNKLSYCERYFQDGEGYSSLLILFETTENICKSIIGDYDSSFYNVVQKLLDKDLISEEEHKFLSTNENSLRLIRNKFAHANLSKFNLAINEFGKNIYYPLSDKESCLKLYKIISDFTFNILLNLISDTLVAGPRSNLDKELSNFKINIKELSSEESLRLLGVKTEDIQKLKKNCDDNELFRLFDNSSSIVILQKIYENLFNKNENNMLKKIN